MHRRMILAALPVLLAAGCHLFYPFDYQAPPDQGNAAPDAGRDLQLDAPALDALSPDAPTLDAPPMDTAPPDVTHEALPPLDLSIDKAVADAPQPDLGLGLSCNSDNQCGTKHCVDGVCCDTACTSTCRACNITGKLGTCSPLPQGTACPSTCYSNSVEVRACDSVGLCQVQSSTPCNNYLCKAGACPVGCTSHADCFPGTLKLGGVCDRRKAHISGQGACLDPSEVVEVKATGSLASAVSAVAATSSKTTVLLEPQATYSEAVAINSPGASVFIVGTRSVIRGTQPATPTATVQTSEVLDLQGVVLTHSGGGTGDGAACWGGTLRIVESEISDNTGVGANVNASCTFELRRSLIEKNVAGGLNLSGGDQGGTSVVVNNVILSNGKASAAGTDFGGISLLWKSSTPMPTLYNNTIISNLAKTGAMAGVSCNTTYAQPYKLINTVVYFNVPSGSTGGCTFEYSIGSVPSGGAGNLTADPKLDSKYYPLSTSKCIDTGASTTGVTVIDNANKQRPKVFGGKVDKGAYEVQ